MSEKINETSWLGKLWPSWREAEITVKKRREAADQVIESLEKLQRSISILRRAIADPPEGVTNQEMTFAKQRLQSALQSEKRAILCLQNLGINTRSFLKNKID